MKRNIKFLLVGAMMTGIFSMSHAETNKISEKEIQQNLETLFKNKINQGFFSEKSIITAKIIKNNNKNQDYESTSTRLGDICKIAVFFDKKGNIDYLGKDEELKEITKLKNETQREMARNFLFLHEQSHCEFSAIEDPVRLEGMSDELNKKVNYALKDLDVISVFSNDGIKEISYIHNLSESYSDVSAITLLIKEHGLENNDLQYLIKTIEVQRKDKYIQTSSGDHNTHTSIEILLKPENIEKINDLSNIKDFQDFVLKVANEGVQKIMFEKKETTERSFSSNNFSFSVLANMLKLSKEKTISISERKDYQSHRWVNENQAGMAYFVAKDIIKDVDLTGFDINGIKKVEGKEPQTALELMIEVISSNPSKSNYLEKSYEAFIKTVADFKKEVYKNNEMKLPITNTIETSEQIIKRVIDLRNKFKSETKSLGNTLNN